MTDRPRSHLLVGGLALVAALVLGARQLDRGERVAGASPPPPIRVEQEPGGRVTVHVAGAVRAPGVYRLRAGARVDDAVRRAGGPTRRADLNGLNLAAEAEDGRQVLVPAKAPRGAAVASAPAAEATAPTAPVSLSTATLEQLDTLDGVGPATAENILRYRDERGGFGSVEELAQVPGIGEKRMAALRELVVP